jgi:predicted GTPase
MTRDLEKTVDNADVDLVISATPFDITHVLKVKKPIHRVRYELQGIGNPTLEDIIKKKFVKK